MILTGSKIIAAQEAGDIVLEPFSMLNVNPNSYNYSLGDKLLRVTNDDCKDNHEEINLNHNGFVLLPANYI